ncbi:MAG TPA: winged helix-turn-helix domain-containing protein [Methanothrix sp.]|nr:winged helix-turn-helix domain-containing protein [Methanothrix sp.]
MKRSKHEIFSKILEICLNGASKTKIVYQANLNFRTVNPYLDVLIKNNLLVASKENHILYKTTLEGANMHETISKVNNMLLEE